MKHGRLKKDLKVQNSMVLGGTFFANKKIILTQQMFLF
jgi:hypothetical protein